MAIYKFNKEKIAYERIRWYNYLFVLLLCFVFVGALSSFIYKEVIIIQAEKEIHIKTSNDFSEDKLFAEIDKYSFKYPDIVKAQAIVESGNFKSVVFKQNNNMFGMREAMLRITVSNGTNLNHAYYDNWKYCVTDRALYEARYMYKLSRTEYFSYLDQVYAKGSGYSDLLKKIIKNREL